MSVEVKIHMSEMHRNYRTTYILKYFIVVWNKESMQNNDHAFSVPVISYFREDVNFKGEPRSTKRVASVPLRVTFDEFRETVPGLPT